MEEAPLLWIDEWNFWARIAAYVFIGLAVLRMLAYYIKLASLKEYKDKYDYINENEIGALWQSSLLLLVGASLLANSFLAEIGIFWFIIRWVTTLSIAIVLAVIINNLLKFYYPFYVEKRLRQLRYRPRISPKTGKPMKLLSEEEEDVYLDEGMQAEEEVFSVDYDVWVDEETGYTKIEKYSGHLHAERCPECGYLTLRVVKEEIVTQPTYEEEGELIKYYICSYCDYKTQTTFKVAKLKSKPAETATA
ncbi:MAG TPA: hypothetical protein ENJ39_05510 [Flammeovirgaceae bacterium]|nr:hypothetical protein [Flammeovirgaceae bacterium]